MASCDFIFPHFIKFRLYFSSFFYSVVFKWTYIHTLQSVLKTKIVVNLTMDKTDYMQQYKQITQKISKKRFLRKPNVAEAAEEFQAISKNLARQECPSYSAFFELAKARCEHTLANSAGNNDWWCLLSWCDRWPCGLFDCFTSSEKEKNSEMKADCLFKPLRSKWEQRNLV